MLNLVKVLNTEMLIIIECDPVCSDSKRHLFPFSLWLVCLASHPFFLQEDVVKITEKCGLSSTGSSSSPVATPLRTPEDLKSNILKAQVEAAALKVRTNTTQNCTTIESLRNCTFLGSYFEWCKRLRNMFKLCHGDFFWQIAVFKDVQIYRLFVYIIEL